MQCYPPKFLAVLSLLVTATAASAEVVVSSDATQNMSCANGTCAPTAAKAVLNATDLQNMLASGDVTLTTTGSGVQAKDIAIRAPLSWSSASRITLDAWRSLTVVQTVTVQDRGGVTILTNDGGHGGELAFSGKGHVTFANLASRLAINGTKFTLVNSLAMLATDIGKNENGNYALAADYDAGKDGTYANSPIPYAFYGIFEALGNMIGNLQMDVNPAQDGDCGLFSRLDGGSVNDLVISAQIKVNQPRNRGGVTAGIVAGRNYGTISRSSASGLVSGPSRGIVGGLVGENEGAIRESWTNANVVSHELAGGIAGENHSSVSQSYATGAVTAKGKDRENLAGGLIGYNSGSVENSYTTAKTTSPEAGGLAGINSGTIRASYATGAVQGTTVAGGLIGYDYAGRRSRKNDYWDMDTSGIMDPSQGAGNVPNDPGITGLSTEQLQSGLPAGFDPGVWAEDPDINGGLPYLRAIPPK